jgi:amino acid transporter
MSYRDGYEKVQREAFWTVPRALLMVLVLMIVVYGLGFLATGGDLAIYRFWAPKYANAQRQVFVNTQSYVQGKIAI